MSGRVSFCVYLYVCVGGRGEKVDLRKGNSGRMLRSPLSSQRNRHFMCLLLYGCLWVFSSERGKPGVKTPPHSIKEK